MQGGTKILIEEDEKPRAIENMGKRKKLYFKQGIIMGHLISAIKPNQDAVSEKAIVNKSTGRTHNEPRPLQSILNKKIKNEEKS